MAPGRVAERTFPRGAVPAIILHGSVIGRRTSIMSKPPFTSEEYAARLRKVFTLMSTEGVDTLVLTDPCSIVWISGYDAWSFYVPQALVVSPQLAEPLWIGRQIDVPCLEFTSWLSPESVVSYTDELVQIAGRHPAQFIASEIARRGLGGGTIGLELDSFYLTPRYRDWLVETLPGARWADIGLKLARLRSVKSPAELEVMRQAAAIVEGSMRVALDGVRVGARESDVAGEIARAQTAGTEQYSGFHISSPIYLLRGRRGTAPHVTWGEGRFERDETAYMELMGCRYRYQVTVSRSVHLGKPPEKVRRAADASQAGILAAIDTARPGRTCGDIARAMLRVFTDYGIEKRTRCGYAIGIAYAPTSGERTMSLHPEDETPLVAGMTFHVHPNLLFEDWGLYITESIAVTEQGGQPFTTLPRDLVVRE